MSKQVIGKTVTPPDGWVFVGGTLQPSGPNAFTIESFDRLYAWAKEKKYGLKPSDTSTHNNGHANVSCKYQVYTDAWETTEAWLGDGKWTPGGKVFSLGKVKATISGYEYNNYCANCMRAGLKVRPCGSRGTKLCAFCSELCKEGCGHWVSFARNQVLPAELHGKCHVCCPTHPCVYCGIYFVEAGMVRREDARFSCAPCTESRTCGECSNVDGNVAEFKGARLCPECIGHKVDAERAKHEEFSASELPEGGTLALTALSNRPVRVISIETEVDGDAYALANTMYNEGLVREGFVESYGTPCPDTSSWPAFLKYDGSVSGGELINYLIQLDKEDHADSLKNVLAKLRSLEAVGAVEYNPNCGGHIHIDAHNFSTDNVWRLVTGYNYLEDVIFRLAGSGHKYGHRTLVPGHDAANAGGGYSHPTVKGPWGIKSNAFNALMRQNRMTGLNFSPYREAVYSCYCGAGAENLRSCKCALPKCTIEWRVWNSQGNPRILHGWIAFMQSLHAWADSPKEMTQDEEKEYPVFAWEKQKWVATSEAHKKEALQRVEWIFTNLVFTDAEKNSLIYAFQQTDMTFPAGFWTRVRAIPSPKNRTVKVPRNCIIREKNIDVTKPERKVFGDPRRGGRNYAAQARFDRADAIVWNNANQPGRIR